jgi:uncharacterized protein YuzE
MIFSFTPQYGFARPDIVFSYYEDTNNLAVYFVKATPGVICDCINATDDILVSYTRDNKIVSIDIEMILMTLRCHMFDVREVIDGKPPFTLNPIYDEDLDTLEIYFVDYTFTQSTLRNNPMKTDIEDIEVELGNTGQIIRILFRNAKERIAKPISEEERKELARICEEKAKEISKMSCEIVKKYL